MDPQQDPTVTDPSVPTPAPESSAADATLDDWHRISPLSILFFIIEFVRQVGLQALPGLIVAAAAIGKTATEKGWILPAVGGFITLVAGYGLLAYLRFRYRVTEDRVLVHRGVLHREELDIEFERIQNINIREPWYMRPFGLAVLGIDTAGSAGKEVGLAGIRKDVALHIRQTIVDRLGERQPQTQGDERPASALTAEGDEQVLLSLDRKDVLLYGLTANFMLWAAIFLGFVFGSGDMTESIWENIAQTLKLREAVEAVEAEGGRTLLAAVISGLAFLALLMLPVISMIGALLRYDGYRLVRNDDTYRRSSGLLTKHDESLRQHKIQAVVWKQNAIARLLGRVNLQLRQASAGVGAEQAQMAAGVPGGKQAFMVPSLLPDHAAELSDEFLPGAMPQQAQFTGIARLRFTLVSMGWVVVPMTLGFSIPALFVHGGFWLPPLGAALLTFLIFYRVSGQYGLAVDGAFGYHRSGFIGRTTTLYPLFKVQRVDLVQTPWQEKRGLAQLTVHLASHSLTLPYVAIADAERFRDLAMYHAESTNQRWF